jgi:hypothetical protein
MVQALLDGRKTQTRRLAAIPMGDHHGTDIMDWGLSKHPYQENGKWLYRVQSDVDDYNTFELKAKYGKPGDLLWVRESWFPAAINGNKVMAGYYDKDPDHTYEFATDKTDFYWKQLNKGRMIPSIHMPKEAARIWLQKADTKVERACDISREDAISEGLACITKDGGRTYKYGIPDRDGCPGTDDNGWPWQEWEVDPIEAFKKLWCKINGIETWNSWVWANSFKILSTTGKPSTLTEKMEG